MVLCRAESDAVLLLPDKATGLGERTVFVNSFECTNGHAGWNVKHFDILEFHVDLSVESSVDSVLWNLEYKTSLDYYDCY
jgi:hypothetical protein